MSRVVLQWWRQWSHCLTWWSERHSSIYSMTSPAPGGLSLRSHRWDGWVAHVSSSVNTHRRWRISRRAAPSTHTNHYEKITTDWHLAKQFCQRWLVFQEYEQVNSFSLTISSRDRWDQRRVSFIWLWRPSPTPSGTSGHVSSTNHFGNCLLTWSLRNSCPLLTSDTCESKGLDGVAVKYDNIEEHSQCTDAYVYRRHLVLRPGYVLIEINIPYKIKFVNPKSCISHDNLFFFPSTSDTVHHYNLFL